MRFIFKDETQEFVAKYFSDLSKAIITVGFASYFFEKLGFGLKITFIITAIAFFILSVILMERKGGR